MTGAVPYRPDIDGLRAIAVAAVLAFHAFPDAVPGGFAGVDVFFVVSGYLITSLLLNGLAQGTPVLADFYARRVKRIFPALICVLLACLAFGWLVLLSDEYVHLGKHAAGAAVFVNNFQFWQEAGYFDRSAEQKVLLHLWSLSIEEQFYLAWPLALIVAHRRGWNLLRIVTYGLIASFALNVLLVEPHPVGAFYWPVTRCWELLLGALLACAPVNAVRAAALRAWAGAGLIVAGLVSLDPARSFPGWWALLPTLGTGLLISAGMGTWLSRRVLAHPALVFIGLISYPLYLWHWPLLAFANTLQSGTPSVALRVGALAASVLLAWLTYRFVESPLRRRGEPLVPIALGAAMAAIGVAALFIYAAGGVPSRAPDQVAMLKSFEWGKDRESSEACQREFQTGSQAYCLHSAPGRPPTVMIIGDSHATHYFPGLAEHYTRRNDNLLLYGGGGCLPFYYVDSLDIDYRLYCPLLIQRALDMALQAPGVHTVILAARGPIMRVKPATTEVTFAPALAETVRRLLLANKEVIFVYDVPALGFDPKTCVPIRRFGLGPELRSPCAAPRRQEDAATANYRAQVASVLREYPAVKTFDPTNYLCDQEYCWGMRDGVLLYLLSEYITIDGSMYLGRMFSRERSPPGN